MIITRVDREEVVGNSEKGGGRKIIDITVGNSGPRFMNIIIYLTLVSTFRSGIILSRIITIYTHRVGIFIGANPH